MSVLPVGIAASGDEGYTIEDSLRFRSSAGAYLSRTTGTSNRRTWTWSGWIKLTKENTTQIFSSGSSSNYVLQARIVTGNGIQIYQDWAGSTVMNIWTGTNTQLRDFSSWYHIVYAIDTTQATSTDRVKIYLNGVQLTAFTNNTYPSQNYELSVNYNPFYIASYLNGVATTSDAYQTEINFIDGQALTADDFGEFDEDTGVWKPKAYSGSYGTNGFYLDFNDPTSTATISQDQSGNGNDFTANNISLTSGTTYDSMTDVPTLTDENTANYCTWNNLDKPAASSTTNGNLTATTSTAASEVICGTFGVSSGKWYWEVTPSAITSGGCMIGIRAINQTTAAIVSTTDGYGYYTTGRTYSSSPSVTYGDTFTTNDIIGVAFDADNGKIWWAKNGVWQASGDPAAGTNEAYSGISGTYKPAVSNGGATSACTVNTTFGQQPFAYTPPTGFLPLNTYNLPDATIEDGSEHFNTVLYTGDGTTSRSITGVGFQPDFVWGKERNGVAHHTLVDAVRGLVTGGRLSSNRTNAEDNLSNATLDSFDSDGFTTGSSTNIFNTSGRTFVAWNWKANGSGVSNTDGSITSTVSANTTSGFSIVSYTGTGSASTVGHGLGVAPSMIIFKNRDGAYDWATYHKDLTSAAYTVYLSLNYAQSTNSTVANYYNSTAPTSSVFSIGASNNYTNLSSNKYIAYCFADIEGFSSFGSYTGNGSTDGPFIYTGFRPSWLMVKTSTYASTNWLIFDSARSPYNAVELELNANNNNQEYDNNRDVDFLSNGFKIRSGSNNNFNTSGGNYIYAAFAENPFKNALAR